MDEKQASATLDATDQALWAISPLDGRYRSKLKGLGSMVGEGGLIGYRLWVEAQWLLHLAEHRQVAPDMDLSRAAKSALQAIERRNPTLAARRIKDIEAVTNHDVKAVEYYLRELLQGTGASDRTLAFIHFGCTSEDINNLAYGLMLADIREERLLPQMDAVLGDLAQKAKDWAAMPMLSRTHGQTASPTTLGKELAVFGHRLKRQRQRLSGLAIEGKINGAVGNFNAHLAAYPDVEWEHVARTFVEEKLGLTYNPLTTQIENHDSLVEFMHCLHQFNTVLIGFCRDMWGYISLGYFSQQVKAGEVGSSTMPHKVNPIDFENAEGNLGIANAYAVHFSDKLPISRWQRDLSDSTVLRTLGSAVGHAELAYHSLLKGLGKIQVVEERLAADLNSSWEVLGEAVQTVLRRRGVADAYERLKAATRGQAVNEEALRELIRDSSELTDDDRQRLAAMTPAAYVGQAARLVDHFQGPADK